MRKTVSPVVALVIIAVVVLTAGWWFYKRVKGPGKVMMTPGGIVDTKTGRVIQRRGPGQRQQQGTQTQEAPTRRGR